MNSYTKRKKILITLICTIIIFISIINLLKSLKINSKNVFNSMQNSQINKNIEENNKIMTEPLIENYSEETIKNAETNIKNTSWRIIIPKINLNAQIKEGTSSQIMKLAVGHFEGTAILNGNIGLAAHNRGYSSNFFQRIKELEEGDKIIYIIDNEKKEFIVQTKVKIKETDWSYLQQTEDEKITLITCVENDSEHRLCIQGIKV